MKIICLGDSLTYGYGVARAVTWTALLSNGADGPEVVNRGISGDTTGGMLARLETDVLAEKSDLVLLMGGSNDIFFGRDLAAAKCNMAAIVFQCMAHRRKVVLGIPFPVLEKGLADQWKPFAGGEEVRRLLGEYGRWLVEFRKGVWDSGPGSGGSAPQGGEGPHLLLPGRDPSKSRGTPPGGRISAGKSVEGIPMRAGNML